jgi:hypothetical protein
MRMAVALYVTGISTQKVHPECPPRAGTLIWREKKDRPRMSKLERLISSVDDLERMLSEGLLREEVVPRDPRIRTIALTLMELIRGLAITQVQRLRGSKKWRDDARELRVTADRVQATLLEVYNLDLVTPLVAALQGVARHVEGLPERHLPGQPETTDALESALGSAQLALERFQASGEWLLQQLARQAVLLCEGSTATQLSD